MKRLICVILAAVLLLAACGKPKLSSEQLQQLQTAHPEAFGLDTSEGLNVLVYGSGKEGKWSVRLVPGKQDHYALTQSIEAEDYPPLTVEEAKAILLHYALPEAQVVLRPYDNLWASGDTLAMCMEDATYLTRMAEAFDDRYPVGEVFEAIYDPAID